MNRLRTFNSRPHKEVDNSAFIKKCSKASFQLTTSQGGRLDRPVFKIQIRSFNSRPHKEVDWKPVACAGRCLSFNSRPHKEVDKSCFRILRDFTTFQLTTSQGGRPLPVTALFSQTTFNSRPHKEVYFTCSATAAFKIHSTHDLTRRSTTFPGYSSAMSFFQLTTSQGGRRRCADPRSQ